MLPFCAHFYNVSDCTDIRYNLIATICCMLTVLLDRLCTLQQIGGLCALVMLDSICTIEFMCISAH